MTASTIIGLLSALLSAVKLIAEYAVSKRLMAAGAAEAILKGTQDAQTAIARASAARDLVRADLERDPASILSDDGFRRD